MKRVSCTQCSKILQVKGLDGFIEPIHEKFFCSDECHITWTNTPVNERPEYNRGIYKKGVHYPVKYCCYNCYLNNEKPEKQKRACSCVLCAEHGCEFCDHNDNIYYDK